MFGRILLQTGEALICYDVHVRRRPLKPEIYPSFKNSKIAGINCAVQGKFLRQDVIPVTDLKLTSSRRNIVTIQVYEVAYMELQVVRKRIDAKAFRI